MADDAELTLASDWDAKAIAWDEQVGEAGDRNRRLNSDPVLWRMLGTVAQRRVLDAGCGTGYLSRQLTRAGALVVGVDISPSMIAIAQTKAMEQGLTIDHRVGSVSTLPGIADASVDAVASNYVLMDLPDLEAAARSISRVLSPGGIAVLIFSHPCFPAAQSTVGPERGVVGYTWPFAYFAPQQRVDPPWRHFTEPFTWWHRPLSHYCRAFRSAGLAIDEIDEPHLPADSLHLAPDDHDRFDALHRPFSIAFRLLRA